MIAFASQPSHRDCPVACGGFARQLEAYFRVTTPQDSRYGKGKMQVACQCGKTWHDYQTVQHNFLEYPWLRRLESKW
jgi:hypothetical protein